ncbi:hypothetical protein H2200_006369 [Cladophialophora chaetospira]|uniref:Uncharacterized protein n=1 Tax=Cladophialophora chaetospira TaxID=386627 RepID=A0AA38XAS9_9EURO|nr:hypothetical protein H2200_006369 [Cladophialophora chaetospira]
MAPIAHVDRELRFVEVSGNKSQQNIDKKERSSVRAFVMRDYLRQKSDPAWSFTPAKVADHMTSHISRFRSTRPPSAARPRRRKIATTRDRRSEDRMSSQRPLVPAPAEMDDRSSTISSPHDLDSLDPYGTLDIDLSDSDTQSLLQYYQTTFWANSYACNPEARWMSVALMDPAIIHATLSLVAIHRRDCFSIDLSKVYFKHRGEAMNLVARRLSNLKESLSDETIGAVALLSSSDNHFDWSEETQSSHSQGLGHLIAMRGGMQKLKSNRHIQRVAGWADLLQSAMHGTSLQVDMPEAVQEASTEGLDPNSTGVEEQALPTGIVLQDLPVTDGNTLRQLRILSSLKVSLLEKRDEELCRTFSNLLWKLEYSILDRPQQKGEVPSRSELLSDVVGIATLIFSYLTLRDLAAPILYKRLSLRLQTYSTALMSAPKLDDNNYLKDGELAILLWSLFIGWRGSRKDRDSQGWFIGQLAQLCWRHGILSYDTLKAKIQSVVPQAHGLVDVSEDFWMQIEDVILSEMLSLDHAGNAYLM